MFILGFKNNNNQLIVRQVTTLILPTNTIIHHDLTPLLSVEKNSPHRPKNNSTFTGQTNTHYTVHTHSSI
jgi:hypothetical protein